ncbi:MAG: hypothetical protein ACXAEN_15570 [Candidatus Thorarchaeota archaeon]|jgi:hypothetical protein
MTVILMSSKTARLLSVSFVSVAVFLGTTVAPGYLFSQNGSSWNIAELEEPWDMPWDGPAFLQILPKDESALDMLKSSDADTHSWVTGHAMELLSNEGYVSEVDELFYANPSEGFPRYSPLQILLFGNWAGDNWCDWAASDVKRCKIVDQALLGTYEETADHFVDLYVEGKPIDAAAISFKIAKKFFKPGEVIETTLHYMVEEMEVVSRLYLVDNLKVSLPSGDIGIGFVTVVDDVLDPEYVYVFTFLKAEIRKYFRLFDFRNLKLKLATVAVSFLVGATVDHIARGKFNQIAGDARTQADQYFHLAKLAWSSPEKWTGVENEIPVEVMELGSFFQDERLTPLETNEEWAMYYLGRALHYLQDANNPYHTIPWYEVAVDIYATLAVKLVELALVALGLTVLGPLALISFILDIWRWWGEWNVLTRDHPFFEDLIDGDDGHYLVKEYDGVPHRVVPSVDEDYVFEFFGSDPLQEAQGMESLYFSAYQLTERAAQEARSYVEESMWVIGWDWVTDPSKLAGEMHQSVNMFRELISAPPDPVVEGESYEFLFRTEPYSLEGIAKHDFLNPNWVYFELDPSFHGPDYIRIYESVDTGRSYAAIYDWLSPIRDRLSHIPQAYEGTLRVAKTSLARAISYSATLIAKFFEESEAAKEYLKDISISSIGRSPVDINLYSPDGEILGSKDPFGMSGGSYFEVGNEKHLELNLVTSGKYVLELTGTGQGWYNLTIEVTESGNVRCSENFSRAVSLDERHFYEIVLVGDQGNLVSCSIVEGSDPNNQHLSAGICGSSEIWVDEGQAVPFSSCSSDPDGTIVSWEWDFTGDGVPDAWGPSPTFTWWDNIDSVVVTLWVTSMTVLTETDPDTGEEMEYVIYETDSYSMVVHVKNVNPVIHSMIGYWITTFIYRPAGEKWHDSEWKLLKDTKNDGDLYVLREAGDPNLQIDSLKEHYIDAECVYTFEANYSPYDDILNGQLQGSTPVWTILQFPWFSTEPEEKLHHDFNYEQSEERNSSHFVHVRPWEIDLSPYFLFHNATFEAYATDVGTDDLTFSWSWGDGTRTVNQPHTWEQGNPDHYPSPYDINERARYPMDALDIAIHAYTWEQNFTVKLEVTDDDGGSSVMELKVRTIHLPHLKPIR